MVQGNLPQQLLNAWPYFQSAGIDPVEINNGGQYIIRSAEISMWTFYLQNFLLFRQI